MRNLIWKIIRSICMIFLCIAVILLAFFEVVIGSPKQEDKQMIKSIIDAYEKIEAQGRS